jgi:hypothetical protein
MSRHWVVVGVVFGSALGAGGLYRVATAEPIKMPLLPVPLSQPKDDQPAWTAPGGGTAPPPRVVPPHEVAPPARAVNPPGPVESSPLPPPVLNLQPAQPRHSVNSSGPVVPPAIELLPPPLFTAPGGPADLQPAPGDTPMPVLPTRQLVMSALFGAALAAAPAAPAVAQDNRDETKPQVDSTEIKRQLDDIQKDVRSLQQFRKNIEDEVFGKGDGRTAAESGLINRLSDIEARIKRIEETLNSLSARLSDPSRGTAAFYPPGPAPGPAPIPGAAFGRAFVRIVNDYPVEASMVVNGRSYRLPPGQTATVEVPPGSYTYELLHAGSFPTTSNIREGETVTLRIR